jgi:hypothetical protein
VFDKSQNAADLPARTASDIAAWLNEHGYGTNADLEISVGMIEYDIAGVEREARVNGYRGGPLHWRKGGGKEAVVVFDTTIYEDDGDIATLFASLEN